MIEDVVRDPQMARKCWYVSKAVGREHRNFELWWNFYFAVYTFPEDVRNRLLKLAEDNHWTLDEFKKHLRDLRHQVRTDLQSFPEGQYGLIYVDPPWKYEHTKTDNRRVDNHYPQMTVEEIQSFADANGKTVQDLAAKNCVLYMWATSPKLEEAISVMNAWGFEYRTNAVWVKELMGMGYYFRQRHELLLVGVKGEPVVPSEDVRVDSVITAAPDTDQHSSKPNAYVCDMLDAQYPKTPKIEIFARTGRAGWESFGNQLPDAVAADALPDVNEDGDVREAGEEAEARKTETKMRAAGISKKKDPGKPRLVKGAKKEANAPIPAGDSDTNAVASTA